MNYRRYALLWLLVSAAGPVPARDDGQNAANDPLTLKPALVLQEYYQPVLNRQPDQQANQFLVRGVWPHRGFGREHLLRLSLPLMTSQSAPHAESQTALGDLTVFDVPLFELGELGLGVGPLLVIPTAGTPAAGTGKWQAGGQLVVKKSHDWGLTAALVSYQLSFAGDPARAPTRLLSWQPFIFYNLPDRYYLRSTAIGEVDFVRHTTLVPIGLGLGRVFALGHGAVGNLALEPQYAVIRSGAGVPTFQVLLSLAVQF